MEPADTVETSAPPAVELRRFGTLEGVFTPTLLTILGVIMYLREGWVVGQVGLLGAWSIILLASGITICTSLSLASIATNVRLGAGGVYAIVRRSLGPELGGSIGIPLYLSQTFAVAMYIFGLREGWAWVFPEHPALVVDLVVFTSVLAIAYASATLAFRVQYVVMAVIAVSLVSILAGSWTGPMDGTIEWWRRPTNELGGSVYWVVFAVFFPATTGIMAGANMSGELKNPRRSIPLGTLSAVGLATLVYVGLAYWLALAAPGEELRANTTVMIDRAAWRPLVLAGLWGACFSSALASMVGAPRILRALGDHGIVPFGRWVGTRPGSTEPRRAMLATGIVALLCIALRDLNVIAPLITLFFLIAYGMINVVVLLEQRLAVVSFRPTFRLPTIVPLLGAVGCVFAMFVVNATFSLVALTAVVLGYGLLSRRTLPTDEEDVRSGIFIALAEWAAHRTKQLPTRHRAWKANLLVPVVDPQELVGNFSLVLDIAKPFGSVSLLGVTGKEPEEDLGEQVEKLAQSLEEAGVHASSTVLEANDVGEGIVHAMQTLKGTFLHPNLLFVTPLDKTVPEAELELPLRRADEAGMGVVLAAMHPKTALGRRKNLHLWVRQQAPAWDVEHGMRASNLNLIVLIGYLLATRWDAQLTLVCVAPEAEHEAAKRYLAEIVELARLPEGTTFEVVDGTFEKAIAEVEHADLNIIGLSEGDEVAFARRMVWKSEAACVFVRDSGVEDALA